MAASGAMTVILLLIFRTIVFGLFLITGSSVTDVRITTGFRTVVFLHMTRVGRSATGPHNPDGQYAQSDYQKKQEHAWVILHAGAKVKEF
jgi:hypothetical protein